MKYIFITPVNEYINIMPIPGIPSLISTLENNGVDCEYINLNAAFDKWLLSNTLKIKEYLDILIEFYKNEEYKNYMDSNKSIFINEEIFNKKKIKWLYKNLEYIKSFDRKFLYNFFYFVNYSNYLINFKSENPLILCNVNYVNDDDFFIDVKSMHELFNSRINNIKEFYEEKAEAIINKDPNIIGIQIIRPQALLSGIYLAYLIKQKRKDIHINIGGNYFELYYKKITNLKELFGNFFDSITIGESYNTVLDIIEYLGNKKSIEEVSNLLYVKNGELRYNRSDKYIGINRLPYQSFTGYKRDDYIMPELILPVRASLTNGCYWGKCIYCTCSDTEEPYRIMSAERFTAEIEYLAKKYNTKYFAFWDNAMHPKYIEKVADIIIEKGLDIKYTMYCRLEEGFSEELLKKIKKSGCIEIYWGLDSVSDDVLKFINKGLDVKTSKRILKNSYRAGIYNMIYLIFGLPTETRENLKETLEYVKENSKYINKIEFASKVLYLENSIMNTQSGYYKELTNLTKKNEEYKNQIMNEINEILKNAYEPVLIQYDFLYIAKYGIKRFRYMNKILYYSLSCKNRIIKKIINIYTKILIHTFIR